MRPQDADELRARLNKALVELYAPSPPRKWRVKESKLYLAVNSLEHNLAILRWLRDCKRLGYDPESRTPPLSPPADGAEP